jgi:hypothetical protein
MLDRRGEFNESARDLTMRSACSERRGMLWWVEYAEGVLVGREKGFDVRGLLSRGADGKPNGDES